MGGHKRTAEAVICRNAKEVERSLAAREDFAMDHIFHLSVGESAGLGRGKAGALGKVVARTETLRSLDVTLKGTPCAGIDLFEALVHAESLEALSITGWTACEDSLKALHELLVKNKKLVSIAFFGCDVTGYIRYIANAIGKGGRLESLSFVNIKLYPEHVEPLFAALEKCPALKELRLEYCSKTPQFIPEVCTKLKRCPALSELSLDGNPLDTHGMIAIGNAMMTRCRIKALSLGDTVRKATYEPGFLFGGLDWRCVQSLSLHGHNFRELPDFLTEVLNSVALRRTKKLSLRMCGIGSSDAEDLRMFLASEPELVELDLSGNTLLDDAVATIAKGLATNTTLRALDLRGAYFGPEGMNQLVMAMKTNKTLTRLDQDSYSLIGHSDLKVLIQRNRELAEDSE